MYQILICVFYPAPWVKDTVPGDKAQYFRDGQSPKYPVGGGGKGVSPTPILVGGGSNPSPIHQAFPYLGAPIFSQFSFGAFGAKKFFLA